MRYKEFITELDIPKIDPSQVPDFSQEKELGKGVEAKVYRDPTNPSIVKIMGTPKSLKDSGYMQYILLSSKYANENPYFPRIHSIEQSKNEHGENTFIIKMEQLFPASSLSKKQLYLLYQQTFLDADRFVNSGKEELEQALGRHFDVAIDPDWAWDPKKVSSDPNFIKACHLIRKVKDRTNSKYDLGSPNIMVRRSNYGFHFVITDPLH